jgi:hypothetical protein
VRPFYGFLVIQSRQQFNGGDVPVFHKKTAHDDLFSGEQAAI